MFEINILGARNFKKSCYSIKSFSRRCNNDLIRLCFAGALSRVLFLRNESFKEKYERDFIGHFESRKIIRTLRLVRIKVNPPNRSKTVRATRAQKPVGKCLVVILFIYT